MTRLVRAVAAEACSGFLFAGTAAPATDAGKQVTITGSKVEKT